ILEPHIILFHPSYFLGRSERSQRIDQLVESAKALNEKVKKIDAMMVVENMLGPELVRDEDREWPLLRSVDEVQTVMDWHHESIAVAIDLNQKKHPVEMNMAMEERLKTVHVDDGTGKEENHYFPRTSEGDQAWIKILSALEKVKYHRPFMYESAYEH